MGRDFWQARWEANQIGFHQSEINPYLRDHWPSLQAPQGGQVFVPLCGKSLDMCWLASQGYALLGVEFVTQAVTEFFAEQQLTPRQRTQGQFAAWSAENITLLCGDFFALTPDDLEQVAAVYDRASLVALPPALRQRYVQHLRAVLPTGVPILLVTLEYPLGQMDGPPFSVSEAEVRELYAATHEISRVHSEDVLSDSPQFQAKGLTRLVENVYVLRPKS